jgi:hypothetical protein
LFLQFGQCLALTVFDRAGGHPKRFGSFFNREPLVIMQVNRVAARDAPPPL